jgi:serine/threonine protein phosphatase PrpC
MFGKSKLRGATFGARVIGASHIRSGTECQDSFRIVDDDKAIKDVIILAVADGHGSPAAEFSQDGSRIAVDVFCNLMADYCNMYRTGEGSILANIGQKLKAGDNEYKPDTDSLIVFLNREGQTKVAQTVIQEWREEVASFHRSEMRLDCLKADGSFDDALLYRKYGSTLIGLVIASEFLFAFQLGDGDIVRVDTNEVEQVIAGDKILGVETHSIGKLDAWKSVLTKTARVDANEGLPYAYFLTSDGFANSYATQEEYESTIKDYFGTILDHGVDAVKNNLPEWLSETSANGCGDDITMVVSYFKRDTV